MNPQLAGFGGLNPQQQRHPPIDPQQLQQQGGGAFYQQTLAGVGVVPVDYQLRFGKKGSAQAYKEATAAEEEALMTPQQQQALMTPQQQQLQAQALQMARNKQQQMQVCCYLLHCIRLFVSSR